MAKYSTPDLLAFLDKIFDNQEEDLKNIRQLLFDRLIEVHRTSINCLSGSGYTPTKAHIDKITSALHKVDYILKIIDRGDD